MDIDRLFYFLPALGSISDFLVLGGGVLLLISGLLLIMWGLIFERIFYMRGQHRLAAEKVISIWEERKERHSWQAHRVREQLISQVGLKLERHMSLIKACVALFPLLGLLGTVTGMIEVFEVMALSGSGNARSMAAGVSKATIPTMAGMVAALSGVATHVWLSKKVTWEKELLSDHLTTDH